MTDFQGTLTALVTPFASGGIDEERLRALVERQIAGGVDGLVPCGTTGEAATLSPEERVRVIRIVVEQAAGRVPVLAGTGANDTRVTVELTCQAKAAGADGALVVTPYYNKPPQEGLYRHFSVLAEECGLPVVLYNVPGRTGVDLAPETTRRLSEVPGIVGIKDATADLVRASVLRRECRPGFRLLSGDDFTTFPFLMVGGDGVISVTANVVPDRMSRLVASARGGELDEARRLHHELLPLTRALFLETNPIPAKTALSLLGYIEPDMRLPLVAMGEAAKAELAAVLEAFRE